MKILSIGNFGHGWDGSICDEEHIAGALEELGHEVHRLQREEIRNTVPVHEIFPGHGYDFILLAQYDGYPESMIPWLKKDKCPIVYWAFDYQADGQQWHEKLVAEADLYLSKRLADSKYPNWAWCSQDFAPQFLEKYPLPIEKDIDVLFTGSYLDWAIERNEIIDLVGKKYNLVIHSVNQWPQSNLGPVMDERLPELYARAKIILSVDHTYEAGYWSDRNSQIIACGGFALFRHVPLSEAIFRSSVAYFWGKNDVLNAIEFWIDRDEDREVIAAEAYQNSEYYKVEMRVNDMLNIVKGIL
jgi:hypothetical protein